MSFEKGSFPLTVFHLPRKLPENTLELLNKKVACKLDEVKEEVSLGWVSGRHLLERELDETTCYCGGHLYANLRISQRKIPSALLKAERRKEELIYMEQNKTPYVPASVRREIKKEIEDKRFPQMPPVVSGMPMVVDSSASMLYLGNSSVKKSEHFLQLFNDTFKFEPVRFDPDMMMRHFKQTPDNLESLRFSEKAPSGEIQPGRDFLTWMWYFSERKNPKFNVPQFGDFELMIEGPFTLSLDGEVEGAGETVVRKCSAPASAEARTSLLKGKKLRKAKISLSRDGDAWSFIFDADTFTFGSFNLPEGEEMELNSSFAERITNLHIFVSAFEECFKLFVTETKEDKKLQSKLFAWSKGE